MPSRNSSEPHSDDDHSEVGGGEPVGLPSATQAIESLAAVLSRGGAVSRELIGLATELGRVLLGTSTLAPAKRDRRFTDPAWSQNPLFRRLVQAYLATTGSLDALVDDLDAHVEDHRLAERAGHAELHPGQPFGAVRKEFPDGLGHHRDARLFESDGHTVASRPFLR